jgi:hypothetical protein
MGYCLRPPLVHCLQPLDRDVKVPHGAKLAVQPLQLIPYPRPLDVRNHRREKRYGRAQSSERDAHLMQGSGISPACRFVTCIQIVKTAARDNSKCGVARHHWIQPRNRGAALPQNPVGPGGSFAS